MGSFVVTHELLSLEEEVELDSLSSWRMCFFLRCFLAAASAPFLSSAYNAVTILAISSSAIIEGFESRRSLCVFV